MSDSASLGVRHQSGLEPLTALTRPAAQQPEWPDRDRAGSVRSALATSPPLVRWEEVRELGTLLARVAEGELCVLQAGDCAEDPAECGAADVALKTEMLDVLGDIMRVGAGRPVVRVGRLAGQFAKPRSRAHETVDGVRLPVFRGPMVNGPEPTPEARRPNPARLLDCRASAERSLRALEALGRGAGCHPRERVWTSHEALLLDYEGPQVRPTGEGGHYLSSAHWPWIGERTRQPGNAHVRLLARLGNPVACKVGPEATAEEVLELCTLLDPRRIPGRLTLIARFGAGAIGRLAPLVRAVRGAGHPVLWMCDPMHGNTVADGTGLKIRHLDAVMNELRGFLSVVADAGGRCAGLHIESSPLDISECAGAGVTPIRGPRYRTLCDPRLNLMQAVAVVAHWQPITRPGVQPSAT
ncbi:3-deoxy-7-phosphoheptulonate synthase [Streptomyces smyrnaeus]|uniref:Phospho-2-dehydro-3-deoxyheptonate aldolase n=1 Tax=Streptomyces smyrnaeus TaxID=1387713 RepID=A0ABS3XVD1_9ACTN|nr:3-deoxy-7-phosphoheptulonate synthase [Streptomyces smyrnaeus]MBO8199352.1 3-deoxy-7-phosphoheptulonate synthase [Streptomyces smyrnaeus]